jgi:hypothetical protein
MSQSTDRPLRVTLRSSDRSIIKNIFRRRRSLRMISSYISSVCVCLVSPGNDLTWQAGRQTAAAKCFILT